MSWVSLYIDIDDTLAPRMIWQFPCRLPPDFRSARTPPEPSILIYSGSGDLSRFDRNIRTDNPGAHLLLSFFSCHDVSGSYLIPLLDVTLTPWHDKARIPAIPAGLATLFNMTSTGHPTTNLISHQAIGQHTENPQILHLSTPQKGISYTLAQNHIELANST